MLVTVGDSRTSPPQGWWAREPPSSGLRGVSLRPTNPHPGVRGPASVVPICLRVSSEVTVWGLGPAQPTRQKVNNAQLLSVLLGQSGQGRPHACQVTTQKLRVIRRQKLRLRLLRATSAASWKTAWTFSWSRAEHSR